MNEAYVYAESELGKGYISTREFAPGHRVRHPKYLPYVILADGTRENLRETGNLYILDGSVFVTSGPQPPTATIASKGPASLAAAIACSSEASVGPTRTWSYVVTLWPAAPNVPAMEENSTKTSRSAARVSTSR